MFQLQKAPKILAMLRGRYNAFQGFSGNSILLRTKKPFCDYVAPHGRHCIIQYKYLMEVGEGKTAVLEEKEEWWRWQSGDQGPDHR